LLFNQVILAVRYLSSWPTNIEALIILKKRSYQMKIEIYLKHIFQEFPVTESISIGGKGVNTWDTKYERNCGCRGNVCMVPLDAQRVNIQRVFLRPESFGGLLYDPTSAVIYKLDSEAYQLIQSLRNDEEIIAIRKGKKSLAAFAKRNNLKEKAVAEFIEQLREYDLW
jgi:hypothetical protein